MATLLERLRRVFAPFGQRESANHQWVEPGNAITRAIFAGAPIEIPTVEPSPLAPVTAAGLDLSAFEEKPIPPLGVEPPLVRPMVAPAWEPLAMPTAATETPKPRVTERDEESAPAAEKATGERRKRRWWRAA
jgi:hypothetical protein